MSKTVNWGHWFVAVGFAVYGVLLSQSIYCDLRGALGGLSSIYPVYLDGFRSAAFLLCAWGIMKWQYWGHRIAIMLLMVEFVVWMCTVALGAMIDYGPHVWNAPLVMTSVLIWLLLPPVRSEYLRRDQIA